MIDRTNNIHRITALGLGVACFAMVAGCGDGRPQRVPVSGVVLIDGAPVQHGFVTFTPTGGRSATGRIDGEGRFALASYEPGDGTLRGLNRVSVAARESLSETKTKWHAPKKYSNVNSSGIEIDITGPTDGLKLELTWGNEKPFIETDG